jgi:hypothetical protein
VPDWPLNDSQLVVAVVLGLMLIVLVVTMLRKARVADREFARLQADVERLSEEVKQLRAAEQRRFMKELNAPKTTTKSSTASPESPPLMAPRQKRQSKMSFGGFATELWLMATNALVLSSSGNVLLFSSANGAKQWGQ